MRILPFRWVPIVILFIIVIFGYTEGTKQTSQIQPTPTVPGKDTESHRSDVEPPVFDAKAYYLPIVENNLFRPLGWRQPRLMERYRLLGIKIPTTTKILPTAIIQKTIGHQTYIVAPGQKLDPDTEVIGIQSKQVTLSKNGTYHILHLPSAF